MEKAATRELDAIAALRRQLPAVELPNYTLEEPDGPIPLVDVFDGRRQLIVYNHMWEPGETWQCGGCTSFFRTPRHSSSSVAKRSSPSRFSASRRSPPPTSSGPHSGQP